jgi:FAD/FMN-containing dehydrogenase
MPDSPSPQHLLACLRDIVGPGNVIAEPASMLPYVLEPRGLLHGVARCVVRPGDTAEVAAVLRLCDRTCTPVVPQGGNTGLVGGQTPDSSGAEIVLALGRMNRIRDLDARANTLTVEAGVTLQTVQNEAALAGRLFPLALASEGSCTIGGNLATNAGGMAVLSYGTMRDLVLGIEVVLADGRVLNLQSKLRKDNTGYDLKNLFIGSEGTLGIITAAVLKLFPRPSAVQTAFVGLASPENCLDLLTLAQDAAGFDLKTFEFMPRLGIELVARHVPGMREPLEARHTWYVLLELAAPSDRGLTETLLSLLESATGRGIIEEAALATSDSQRSMFWKWREALSGAQTREGSSIKHDISVPIASVPSFLKDASFAVEAMLPGARPVPFGHLGDGNIHFNVSQPVDAESEAFLSHGASLNDAIHALVMQYGGSISAEHGIGALKRAALTVVKDPVALDVMRSVKRMLDPKGILNPGKVL